MKTISKVLALACALTLCVACGPKVTGNPEEDAATYMELIQNDPSAAADFMSDLVENYTEDSIWDFFDECGDLAYELDDEVYYEIYDAVEEAFDAALDSYDKIYEEEVEEAVEAYEEILEVTADEYDVDAEELAEEVASKIEDALSDLF